MNDRLKLNIKLDLRPNVRKSNDVTIDFIGFIKLGISSVIFVLSANYVPNNDIWFRVINSTLFTTYRLWAQYTMPVEINRAYYLHDRQADDFDQSVVRGVVAGRLVPRPRAAAVAGNVQKQYGVHL